MRVFSLDGRHYGRRELTSARAVLPVAEGDRVAQLILERIVTPEITEVDVRALSALGASLARRRGRGRRGADAPGSSQSLSTTVRGEGGFGSTGGFSGGVASAVAPVEALGV